MDLADSHQMAADCVGCPCPALPLLVGRSLVSGRVLFQSDTLAKNRISIVVITLAGVVSLILPMIMAGFSYSSKLAVISKGSFREKLALFFKFIISPRIAGWSWLFYTARLIVEAIFRGRYSGLHSHDHRQLPAEDSFSHNVGHPGIFVH